MTSCLSGNQQAFDDTLTHLGPDPFGNNTNSNSVEFDLSNQTTVQQEDNLIQLKKSTTGLCPEGFDVPSTSGQNCIYGEFSSDSLLKHTYAERHTELSASGGDISLHNDRSHVTVQSRYSADLESLDNVIASEHSKKVHLLFLFKSDDILTFRVVASESLYR